jgi:hypothetical protein
MKSLSALRLRLRQGWSLMMEDSHHVRMRILISFSIWRVPKFSTQTQTDIVLTTSMAEEQVEEEKVSAVMVLVVKHKSDVLPWVGWLIFLRRSCRSRAFPKDGTRDERVHSCHDLSIRCPPLLLLIYFICEYHGGKIRQRN